MQKSNKNQEQTPTTHTSIVRKSQEPSNAQRGGVRRPLPPPSIQILQIQSSGKNLQKSKTGGKRTPNQHIFRARKSGFARCPGSGQLDARIKNFGIWNSKFLSGLKEENKGQKSPHKGTAFVRKKQNYRKNVYLKKKSEFGQVDLMRQASGGDGRDCALEAEGCPGAQRFRFSSENLAQNQPNNFSNYLLLSPEKTRSRDSRQSKEA